ncbi:hypothetical protein GCM10010399_87730 [Dactylosporangium fulvum]|uniref:MmcQ/YjbR family DNA-binding protein n=1 Tax=Dactylosporangium fulvum TaxID=53359 RepID=A0ABY5WCD6_9ACTN|nr:MmcQ/YjbR family DNA-binding protein [Dactylosporangium fulvum]UWP86338.1 MmcQ/YjbR family DNA-binding protein [Dactylosporangium fulvum]
MVDPDDVPAEYLEPIRAACLALPEAYEEPAWAGTRWRIRQKTFAHVLVVDPDHQAAYAKVVGTDEPVCVLTFRSPGDEMAALVAGGYPFYKAAWGVDVVGMVLDGDVDWEEVGELLTESYRVQAPKKLSQHL